MRIVVALGGNALRKRGEAADPRVERRRVRAAARALAPVVARHEVVLVHGNGPQVGLLAGESQDDRQLARPYPLDVIGAETQGMIGYCLAQELASASPGHDVVALVTQTVVDELDPAFAAPTKFIGSVLTAAQAGLLALENGWAVRPDGDAWRRVVPAPVPLEVVELPVVELLLQHGATVICGGGGGVPVRRERTQLVGVEAVVDKDATAALLAVELDADRLVILTDVDTVKVGFGTSAERPLHDTTPMELRSLTFAAGSMGPKVEACAAFVAQTGRSARIGALKDAEAVIAGHAGTRVRPDDVQELAG